VHQPNGIVLVTGPTGSRVSRTTLYSVLARAEVNDPDVNICTVEDPIEIQPDGVNQFQVNEKAGFQFSTALRALLRQDPDIIMVGEIRDVRTPAKHRHRRRR
jgi:type II secretory ATPase GspE/PulE/Tfp pilus assembly ATPase PilB-like protein